MPAWRDVLGEVQAIPSIDNIRRKYLKRLQRLTKRNVIAYYSGFLTNRSPGVYIGDADVEGFMNAIHGLDPALGLDLILHTPGGTVSAAGAIVRYLRSFFGTDIRCLVPQIAMSAGTMTACACREIWMGKQSSIGPIDPQFDTISCGDVVAEFNKACLEVPGHPELIPIWQIRLSKYPPAFVEKCQQAQAFSVELVSKWLETGMFENDPDAKMKADGIVNALGDHQRTKQHDRHICAAEAREIGLVVRDLETDDALQDALLSVHHAYMLTFSGNPVVAKIIENHMGHALVSNNAGKQP